ncbi:MAG: sensor histidine kinase [Blastocatellia bacterium]
MTKGQEENTLDGQIVQLCEDPKRVKAKLSLMTSIMGVTIYHALLYHKVIGFARLIQDVAQELKHTSSLEAHDDILREYLEMMDGSAGELLESLKVIRTVSVYDGVELFSVNDLICDFFNREFSIASHENVDLILPPLLDRRLYVRANKWWVKQVLRVIAENAINAMKTSSTKLLTVTAQATNNGYVKINLADTGPGVSSDLLQRLFKEVIKSDDERGRGLGTALAAIIVESYDGIIAIEESSETGTSITVLLPHIAL